MDHTKYQAKTKKMTITELRYTISDCNEVLDAMPDGTNAGYYADEINYCAMEIARREKDPGGPKKVKQIGTRAESKKKIRYNTDQYIWAHSTAPRGFGYWGFEIVHGKSIGRWVALRGGSNVNKSHTCRVWINGTLTDAKKKVADRFLDMGIIAEVVSIMS